MRTAIQSVVLTCLLAGCGGNGGDPSAPVAPPSSTTTTAKETPAAVAEPPDAPPADSVAQSSETSPTVPPQLPALSFQLQVIQPEENPALAELIVSAEPDAANNPFAGLLVEGAVDARFARSVLSLRIAGEEQSQLPPVLGRYELRGQALSFTPAVPLLPGRRYVARFDPAALRVANTSGVLEEQTFEIPAPAAIPPRITAVYPSGPIVPANHLKFYIYFSEPMQQGDIFDYFTLENVTQEKPVEAPFRHTELWTSDNRRLTLWFHPGRQKEGVNLNVEFGPVLKENEEYRLVISGKWTSQRGLALGEDTTKEFRAGAPDHAQPDVEKWICSSPQAGTREVLRCDLHEPLDWALLHSAIQLRGPDGRILRGTIEPGFGELSWNFEPAVPWKAGTHRLEVESILEDLAGNSVERPFEVDLEGKPVAAKPRTVVRDIEVAAPSANNCE